MSRARRGLSWLAVVLACAAVWLRRPGAGVHLPDAANAWVVVATAIWLQAVPFLVLGLLVTAGLRAFVSTGALERLLPSHPAGAVPVAGLAGMVLPGCECASVPTARQLVRQGVHPAAAMTFLLSSPAVNPVVLAATAVAFPGRPWMVVARFVASLLAAMLVGWAWLRLDGGRTLPAVAGTRRGHGHDHRGGSRADHLVDDFVVEFCEAAGFLAVGAALAATVKVVVPTQWLLGAAGQGWTQVLVLAGLAVLMAICSESDAFVAASFTAFSPTALLAFMVVGPMVDVKLVAMQHGAFGRRFVTRFAPLTFVACVASATAVGMLLPAG